MVVSVPSEKNVELEGELISVGCWGPAFTMASHAALGVVRAGVAVLKGTGVRINCISPGQIDVGVDLQGVCLPVYSARFGEC